MLQVPARPSSFGKYDLLTPLARGGMAEIYLARIKGASGFEKLVVVKMLLDKLSFDTEYVEMFLDEARINARLSHSNVVQVLELGQFEGKYFMAMEYVAGLSVATIGKLATQRLGNLPQQVAAGIVAQAAGGIHYAHEKKQPDGTLLGIIHRDISPQNLIVSAEGIVKVVDFGIAKAEGRSTQTKSGVIKGKYAYMSPEQCLGEEIDRRCDIFALGIVLFELCTSRRLFKRDNSLKTYEAITACKVPDPRVIIPSIAKEISAVVLKALARQPKDRFQTAEEFQEAMNDALKRANLRGTPAVLAQFLEETFPAELTQQRQTVARAIEGSSAPRSIPKANGQQLEPEEETGQFTPPPKEEEPTEPTLVDAKRAEQSQPEAATTEMAAAGLTATGDYAATTEMAAAGFADMAATIQMASVSAKPAAPAVTPKIGAPKAVAPAKVLVAERARPTRKLMPWERLPPKVLLIAGGALLVSIIVLYLIVR